VRAVCGVCLGLGLASVMPASQAFAAVSDGAPPSSRRFEVVPAEHPAVRTKARSTTKIRPAVVVQSDGVSEIVRQGFIRAAVCGGLGTLGLIFIGYRLHGRRHGKAAT
jgi:hypothetical protein